MILRFFLVKPVFCSGRLLCLLSLLLVTCAPLPKEGESRQQAEVTLTLQHRADRLARSGTASRLTEFIVVVPGGTAFSEQGPSNFVSYGILDLQFNQITLSLDLDTSLQLSIYRYAETFSLSQLETKLANQTLDQDAIDFGVTEPFSISSESSTTSQSLTVQLQREALFLDSAVKGLTYSTGGTTATTNQDGLLYYFPDNLVSLSLGNLPLGNFTQPPAVLTPYSLFEVTEGESDDRVTNFARLLQSMDRDTDPQNGIQLDAYVIAGLNPNLNFGDNSSVALNGTSFDQLAVPADRALRHLAGTMRLKNLGALKPFTTIPAQNEDHTSPSGLIGVVFDENLRASTIGPASFLLSDSNGSPLSGTLSTERNWLLFKPTTALPQHSQFNATVSRGLMSQSGRSLEADFSWSFSTADHPSSLFPRLVQLHPDNNSTSVPTNSVLSLTFDGPLFVGSQGIRWNLQLDNGSQVSCANSLQSISISCLPSNDLTANDNFTITLVAGSLRSFEGLENDNLSWRFQTGSGPSSGVASLQHLGEFHDNVSRDRLIGLMVGEGGSQYQLGQGEAPVDNESKWRLPLFYPVQVPFELEGAEGEQNVRVWYRQDNGTLLDNRSVTVNLDYSPPIGLLTLPKATNQPTLPYLVMANDNLSGAWRYLVTRINSYPAKDLESWQDFPHSPMSLADRSQLWDNITRIDPRWECVRLEELRAFANGVPNPGNDNPDNSPACDAPGIASFDNFSSLLPAWDNQSFVFDNLSDPNPQSLVLWVQDRAGNIGWGYPFEILFDNVTPDLSQVSLEQDNGSSLLSATALRLELFHSNKELRFQLLLSGRDNDSVFLLAQLDNASTPAMHDANWQATGQQYYSIALDNTSDLQQQTLSLWLKDQAGNIAALSTRTAYWSRLYDGEERLDNQSSPTANRYAALTLKYPQTLSSSYPLEQLRVSRSSDNQSVSGQWNIDNDSLVFWMEGPLQPEQGYQLEIKGHVDNLSLYASQVFHFQSDNQTLDLNQGLVAYYPLDENPPVERQNQETAVANGGPSLTRDRFNRENNSLELDGVDDYVKGITNTKLPFGNSKRSLCAWIRSNDDNNGMPVRYGDDVTNGGFGIYLNDSDQWSLWKHNSDINSGISDNSRWNLHCLLYDQNYLKYYYNLQNVIDQSILSLNTASSDNLTIGWSHDLHYFRGKLDEIRVYNRPLQIAEIKALYAVADPNPPEITSSTPANNETGFSVADNLTITFDKPLDGSTIQVSSVELRRSDNTTVAGNLYLDPNDNRSLIFDPIENLSSLTNYTLYLHSSIRDFIGNSISPTQIPFQTQMLGGGSATDPFLISNEEGLREIIKNMNAHYTFTNNIILTKVWTPLGTNTNKFNGTINGDNYTICNLIIDNQTDNFTGFFRFVSGTINDLKFKDAYIRGYERVGLLSGKQTTGSISHIEIDNLTVVGLHSKSGGIIGESFGSITKISIKNLNLSGQDSVGGLVGRMAAGSIQLSSVMGNVAGDNKVGGLVGNLANGSITNSYALTDITDSLGGSGMFLGGLTGRYSGAGPIKNSYAIGSILGGTDIGGVVGDNDSGGIVINTYYNSQLAQSSFNTIGDNRTETQLKHTLTSTDIVDGAQTYTGWDFNNIWDPGSACDYPRLRWQNEPLQVSCVLHDGLDNANAASRSAGIQIGFNRPLDNNTLIFGDTLKITPAVRLDNFSYDNTSQILTLQPAEPLVAGTVYTIQFQNIRSADQQSIIDNFTHTFTTGQLGAIWIQATANADFLPLNAARLEVFQNKLWLLGGNNGSVSNQIWTSENGVDWSIFSTSTQSLEMWVQRQNHSSTVFQNKLWVLGGHSGSGANPNSIWSSPNGVTWSITENSEWSKRWRNSTVVFNDRLWVIGGHNSGWKNDAWSSVDGTNWDQENTSSVWVDYGAESTAVVFDGKIWMLGGWQGPNPGTLINTIRNSSDGKTWQTVTPQGAIWEPRWDHQAVIFDNKIWVIGGEVRNDSSAPDLNFNDVWYTADGTNWIELVDAADWPARSRFTSTIFDNKLWIATGDNGAGQRFNDVWYTEGSGLIVASMRDNATDINRTPELWMRLSYPLNPDSLNPTNFFLQQDNGSLSSGTPLMDPDNITLRFVPDGPLDNSTAYQLIGTTGLKKQSDNKSIFQINRLLPFTTDTINPSANLSDGLIAYYPMNGNGADLGTNSLDATNHGATSSTSRLNGNAEAMSFGGGDYLQINDNSLFKPTGSLTISVWAYSDDWSTSCNSTKLILSKTQSSGYNLGCFVDSGVSKIRSQIMLGSSYVSLTHPTSSLQNGWHHFAVVHDHSSDQQILYIDGNIAELASSANEIVHGSVPLSIGAEPNSDGSASFGWRGQIDEVMLYNRALNQDEIHALINVSDSVPPLEGGVLVNSGADNTTSDTLTLNLTSRDASPIVAYQVTDNGSFTELPWISDNLTPSDNINFTTNFTLGSPLYGERQIQVRFQDQASNISQPFSDNITRLDTTPPQHLSFSLLGTAGNDNFTNSANVSFTASATDDVAAVGMYLSENSTPPLDNASSWQSFSTSGTFQLSSGQGAKQIYLWFKDAAQNISGFLMENINFDNVSPTANSILINNGADNTTSSTVTLSFYNVMGASHYFATDDSATSIPSATAAGWRDYPSSGSDNFTLTGTGMREIQVWFKDEAGNVSGSYSDNISWIVIEVSYSENFTAGTLSSSSSQCTNWNHFRDSLNGNYSSIRINGSNDSIGKICSGSAATELCNALKSGTPTSSECGGTTWRVGTCGGIELSASTSGICTCDAAFTVRPCIGNQNWGGIGGSCGSNTQSLSVVCSQ